MHKTLQTFSDKLAAWLSIAIIIAEKVTRLSPRQSMWLTTRWMLPSANRGRLPSDHNKEGRRSQTPPITSERGIDSPAKLCQVQVSTGGACRQLEDAVMQRDDGVTLPWLCAVTGNHCTSSTIFFVLMSLPPSTVQLPCELCALSPLR
jgi:hypothetical protein